MGMVYGWSFEIVDIETAFLYGELEEEIYMDVPEGLAVYLNTKYDQKDCVILDKSIYGLVQAARQFHQKLITVLVKEMKFRKCAGDECLLMRKNDAGTVVICVYNNDALCVGEKDALDQFKKELRTFFATKEEGTMDKYVGCQIKRINDDCMIMHQTDLLKKIERIFSKDIKKLSSREMPFGTHQRIVRPKEEDKLISKEMQTKYRSGIGMLLYLVKYSRPDLPNAIKFTPTEKIYLLHQVDDFAIVCDDKTTVTKCWDEMDTHLKEPLKRESGLISRHNGIDILQSSHGIKMSCQTYLKKILQSKTFDMIIAQHKPLPLNSDKKYILSLETDVSSSDPQMQQNLETQLVLNTTMQPVNLSLP